MPWVVRDVVHDINKAVGQRWQGLDPLLPEPVDLPEGCAAPLLAAGENGRAAGLGVCLHQHVPADTLAQTWGAAVKFVLTLRVRGPDTRAAADQLLAQWRDHLAGVPEAGAEDTAAIVNWPARDVTGVLALLRHGLQPITVIAARPAGRPVPADSAGTAPGLVIRAAGRDDVDVMTEMEMGVVRYDAHFGGSIPRPATEELVRAGTPAALGRVPAWTWLAEMDRRPVGLAVVEPPDDAAWIADMARPGRTAYLPTMFVRPGERSGGIGAALVRRVHRELDARGIDVTLLHYSQMNPLSGPFWHRMGYRPLWSTWEARPASAWRRPASVRLTPTTQRPPDADHPASAWRRPPGADRLAPTALPRLKATHIPPIRPGIDRPQWGEGDRGVRRRRGMIVRRTTGMLGIA